MPPALPKKAQSFIHNISDIPPPPPKPLRFLHPHPVTLTPESVQEDEEVDGVEVNEEEVNDQEVDDEEEVPVLPAKKSNVSHDVNVQEIELLKEVGNAV